ncbi:MAG: Fe-S cluster assembly protein SufD [Chitinophagales bacterium]
MTTLKDVIGTTLQPGQKPFNWPTRDEAWKYTNVRTRFPESLILETPVAGNSVPASIAPEIPCYSVVFTDGQLSSPWPEIPHATISALAADHENSQPEGAIDELNQKFAKSGYHIRVAKGAVVDRPIIITHRFSNHASAYLVQYRNQITVSQGASIQIIERYETSAPAFLNSHTHVAVGAQARVDIQWHQISCEQLTAITSIHADLEQDALFNAHVFSMSGQLLRNNLTAALNGSRAHAALHGLAIAHHQNHIDNHIAILHNQPNGESHQLFKTVLRDQATGVFNGRIFVKQDAQKTNAFQSSKAILLSEEATMNSKPQLEIFADDVKCSHGAAIGQVKHNELFYLKARGIDEVTAKNMLVYAFAAEVIQTLEQAYWRDALEQELKAHLHIEW